MTVLKGDILFIIIGNSCHLAFKQSHKTSFIYRIGFNALTNLNSKSFTNISCLNFIFERLTHNSIFDGKSKSMLDIVFIKIQ